MHQPVRAKRRCILTTSPGDLREGRLQSSLIITMGAYLLPTNTAARSQTTRSMAL
jgi:hypothetical protein